VCVCVCACVRACVCVCVCMYIYIYIYITSKREVSNKMLTVAQNKLHCILIIVQNN